MAKNKNEKKFSINAGGLLAGDRFKVLGMTGTVKEVIEVLDEVHVYFIIEHDPHLGHLRVHKLAVVSILRTT